MPNRTVMAVTVAAAAAIAGGWWITRGGETGLTPAFTTAAEAQETTATAELPAVPDMVMGQADAPVTVIEYASFTCPHCAHFHDTVFDQFKTNYIDTGKVRFVYREVYFDKFGLWAAMVARCGGDMRYFGIADMLYDTQREWLAPGEATGIAENLRKIGLKAGIEGDAVDACLRDNDTAKALVAAYQANATADNIDSTPSFVIDGTKYGNMSYEEFSKLLDEKLAN